MPSGVTRTTPARSKGHTRTAGRSWAHRPRRRSRSSRKRASGAKRRRSKAPSPELREASNAEGSKRAARRPFRTGFGTRRRRLLAQRCILQHIDPSRRRTPLYPMTLPMTHAKRFRDRWPAVRAEAVRAETDHAGARRAARAVRLVAAAPSDGAAFDGARSGPSGSRRIRARAGTRVRPRRPAAIRRTIRP